MAFSVHDEKSWFGDGNNEPSLVEKKGSATKICASYLCPLKKQNKTLKFIFDHYSYRSNIPI